MKRYVILWFLAATVSFLGQSIPSSVQSKVADVTGTASSPDPALEQPQVIPNPSPEYASSARKWQGIPGIERAPNGRLWAVWYSGGNGEGADNYIVLVTSDDDGRSWSQPKLVISPAEGLRKYVREFDPCLWLDPTGRLRLFWTQSVAWWDGRGGVWSISTNSPDSFSPEWSKPRRLADGVMLNKPIALSSGPWLLPIAGWRSVPGKATQRSLEASGLPPDTLVHSSSMPKGSNVFESDDHLGSIHFLGQAQVPDTSFDELKVVERHDKSFWMLVRTTYGIGQAVSTDKGKVWTSEGDTNLSHVNSRFFLYRLRSGNLLLVSNLPPSGTGRSHLTARLSRDDGKTWSKGLLLDGRDKVSYPDGTQAADGRIFIIYDHDRNGAGEILMSVVTEQDIFAGHIVSKHAQLAIVVNALQKQTEQEVINRK